MQSQKYGCTYHLPFSEGVTSDDKILWEWEAVLETPIVITEKLDGENTCLKSTGVYARSHTAPTRNPWAGNMWEIWNRVQYDLGDLEVFGENLYGIHSIEYEQLSYHFYVFAIRVEEEWLSWDEVIFYAEALGLATAPVLEMGIFSVEEIKTIIATRMKEGSVFGGACEGVVLRQANAFQAIDFKQKVLKYVRKNHVKTDEHWTKKWKRASLWYEKNLAR